MCDVGSHGVTEVGKQVVDGVNEGGHMRAGRLEAGAGERAAKR